MYPCIHINLDKIAENVRAMKDLTEKHHIEITGVTKVFGGEERIAQTLVNQGIKRLGDSRIENIRNYENLPCEKWLIRMPSISEAREVVQFCDVSVNSELETLKALNQQAIQLKKKHKVILMVDLGDLREGYFKEEHLAEAINYAKQAKGLDLYGLGTNLTCFSFVQSDEEKMNRLLGLAKKYDASVCISGGNSATIHLMLEMGFRKESITFVLVSLCCLAENGQTMSICREPATTHLSWKLRSLNLKKSRLCRSERLVRTVMVMCLFLQTGEFEREPSVPLADRMLT